MCDTLVAVGRATADGSVILAKNSDRRPNEAHMLVHMPRASHEPGSSVQCTYIEIPQVSETYEVLLSKPFWIWGCEMGANEHGIAIGNEAVFTKEPYEKGPGLIGMDFIRLGLERADTARRAMETILELLEKHGQGGNCGLDHKEYYHNSFLIADAREAWVLETAGKFWAAEQVRDVRAISNGLTIGSEWDLASPGLVEHAIEKGWCKSHDDFHFARCYSDFVYTTFSGSKTRQRRSTEMLEEDKGHITVEHMIAALRDHGKQGRDPYWHPGKGWLMESACVHAGFGPTRASQSTGALVTHLAPGLATHWATGTSGTCTGLFKPVYLGGAGLPDLGPEPSGTYDPEALWWKHERLHRRVIRDYASRMPLYQKERDILEATFLAEAADADARDENRSSVDRIAGLKSFTASCFERAEEATLRWTDVVSSSPVRHRPPLLFSLAWDGYDRKAGFVGGAATKPESHQED